MWLFCLLSKNLFLKSSLFWSHLNAFEYANFSDLRQILEDFWDNSWKTLGRLLGKSSNVFYARRLPTKFSESLPKSSAQSGTKRWCEVESKLIYVEE